MFTAHNRSVYVWWLLARQFKGLWRLGLRTAGTLGAVPHQYYIILNDSLRFSLHPV
jgi:hypothetical protein